MYLISCIPPSDEASYKIALQLLIEKYGDKLNDYIKNNYLNGDPLKLGGHMCGRPCEVASGQGMEKTGGNIKMLLGEILGGLNKRKEESKNPFWILLAAAKHKKYHASGSKGRVATAPDKYRHEYLFAYQAV
jgi:hypothetical protein